MSASHTSGDLRRRRRLEALSAQQPLFEDPAAMPPAQHVDPDPVDPRFGSVHGAHARPVLQGPCESLGRRVARRFDVPGCDHERGEQTWMGGPVPRLERAAVRWSRVDIGIDLGSHVAHTKSRPARTV